jgi:xylulokinase
VKDLVLGVDSSTTACKVIAFDAEGRAVAEGRAAIPLHNPSPGAWEQDAEDWWRALCEASRACVAQIDPARLGAMAIANQRETFVLTDDHGRPLTPALVWMDHRCAAAVERVVARVGHLGRDWLHEVSGKPACTTPSLYKLAGLFERQPEMAEALARHSPAAGFVEVHGFLAWRLSGKPVSSLAAADPTGLVAMMEDRWSPELMAVVGLRAEQLAVLHKPADVMGTVTESAAAATGLPAGLPIVAGAGDGQAAGLGAGIVAPGTAYLNLGTAIVSGVLSREYRYDRAFRTLYGAAPGTYFLETDLQGGTFTITWLCEKLLGKTLAILDELERDASGIAPGSEGLFLVPYWNGVMNPYWDDAARGILVGLSGEHRPAHLYRALLEGIALEQRLHTTGVEAASGPIDEMIVMGGGSKSALWCQILADAIGKPMVRAGTTEATALGAAMLAAVATGLHPSIEEAARAMSRRGERFDPGPNRAHYDALFPRYRSIYPAISTAGGGA